MKIEAKDLRVGNIVKEGVISFIDGDTFGYNSKHGTRFDNVATTINPEQITEEWLLKFGFKLGTDEQFLLKVVKGALHPISFRFCFQDNECYGDFWIGKGSERLLLDIAFVHQLQNLFFALTGEELILKQ